MRTLTHQQQSIKLNKFVTGRIFRDFLFLSHALNFLYLLFLAICIHIYNRVKRVTELPRMSIAFFSPFDSIRIRLPFENASITMRSDPMRCDANRIHCKMDRRKQILKGINNNIKQNIHNFLYSSHEMERAREWDSEPKTNWFINVEKYRITFN